MKAAGIVTCGTNGDHPDFAGIARAVGQFGTRVEKAGVSAETSDAIAWRSRKRGVLGRPGCGWLVDVLLAAFHVPGYDVEAVCCGGT
jgi:hypothetical protein